MRIERTRSQELSKTRTRRLRAAHRDYTPPTRSAKIGERPRFAVGPVVFPGFLVGDGGQLDQFLTKLNDDLEKFRKRVEKRLRGYIAFVRKQTSDRFRSSLVVPPLRVELAPAPNKPTFSTSSQNRSQPLRIFMAAGGSSRDVANDGTLCFWGRAFVTSATERINTLFDGPGEPIPSVNVPTSPGTGAWNSCFVGLPEGNYRLLVDQDPNHDLVFLEAATEFVAIGLP